MSKSGYRLVSIYEKLRQGRPLKVDDLVGEFDVSDQRIHDDIAMLRDIIEDGCHDSDKMVIEYIKTEGSYRLIDQDSSKFTRKEALALKEMILSCGQFDEDEIEALLHKLKFNTAIEDGESDGLITKYERSHYKELMSMFGDVADLIDKKLL